MTPGLVAALGMAVTLAAGVVVAFVWFVVQARRQRGFRLTESVLNRGAVHRVKIRRRRDGRAYARVVPPKRP